MTVKVFRIFIDIALWAPRVIVLGAAEARKRGVNVRSVYNIALPGTSQRGMLSWWGLYTIWRLLPCVYHVARDSGRTIHRSSELCDEKTSSVGGRLDQVNWAQNLEVCGGIHIMH